MSADSPQPIIRAAHVPTYDVPNNIEDPSRSLAKVELYFEGLQAPSNGQLYDGALILFIRDDGHILGTTHDHPVTMSGVYQETGEQVGQSDLGVLNEAAQQELRNHDLLGIWQDSRMFALYYEARQASLRAKAAYRLQQRKIGLYEAHVNAFYEQDEDGGLPPKVESIDYILLDEDGNSIPDGD